LTGIAKNLVDKVWICPVISGQGQGKSKPRLGNSVVLGLQKYHGKWRVFRMFSNIRPFRGFYHMNDSEILEIFRV
jgi:hypothetical protein